MEQSTRRATWIVVLVIIIVALAAGAYFVFFKHKRTITNTSNVASTIKHQQYTQYNAPKGQAIGGFPTNLLPSNVAVTSSYHNQYNGLEQYTVNAQIGESMSMTYVDYQTLLQQAGYKITKQTSTDNIDTINATQGNNYLTLQFTPQSTTATNIVANYGVPTSSQSAAATSSTAK